MTTLEDITVIIVNYRTYDLSRHCIESLLAFYPDVKGLLIDNGSRDESSEYLREMTASYQNLDCILNAVNIYHGPAMHQGILHSDTRYVFTLDSDCEWQQGGMLEAMLEFFQDPFLYAVGKVTLKNRFGFHARTNARQPVRYLHPHALLLDREKYFRLPPFIHHGAPCLRNMQAVEKAGFHLQDFPIENYVLHKGRGTCSRYGYGLSPMTLLAGILTEVLPCKIDQLRTRLSATPIGQSKDTGRIS